MKTLFTYILDFRGGTYVSQIEASGLEASIPKWIKTLHSQKNQIQFLGEKTIQEIEKSMASSYQGPTPLTGLSNVWCLSFASKQGSGMVNIIKTAK